LDDAALPSPIGSGFDLTLGSKLKVGETSTGNVVSLADLSYFRSHPFHPSSVARAVSWVCMVLVPGFAARLGHPRLLSDPQLRIFLATATHTTQVE
jgi:hypothetical protein